MTGTFTGGWIPWTTSWTIATPPIQSTIEEVPLEDYPIMVEVKGVWFNAREVLTVEPHLYHTHVRFRDMPKEDGLAISGASVTEVIEAMALGLSHMAGGGERNWGS